MKKLLVLVVFIMIATSAQAEKILGDVECTGSGTDRECTQDVVCDTDPCLVLLNNELTNNATCLPDDDGGFEVTMVANADGDDPSCTWVVTEGEADNDPLVVVIDSSVGLPVETESFSVE